MIRSGCFAVALLLSSCGNGAAPGATGTAVITRATEPAPAPAVAAPEPARTLAGPFPGGEAAFRSVKDALLKGYAGAPVGEDALYRAAVQGMLEHVDPERGEWNKLLSPDDLAALRSDLAGEVVGVGAEIRFDPATGYTDVLGVLPGSPAEKAALAPGDTIVDVNGKLFRGKTQRDVLSEIRGKVGETVTLTVLRVDKLLVVPIVRELVAYEASKVFMLPDAVGYLRIKGFNARTRASVEEALAELSSHHARAIVVDLRGNPGGSFDEAIAVAEALLPAGAFVVRVAKRGADDQTYTAKGARTLVDAPMAVLVDGDTSSGGEVVAAALREGRHATVVGKRTFGKWSVQRIDDLSNGYAIKYTVGVLYAATGKTYDRVGLEPDVAVDADKAAQASAFRESDPVRRLALDAPLRTAATLLRR